MLFSLYNRLMGLAKESLQHEGDTPEGEEADSGGGGGGRGGLMGTRGPDLVDLGADTDPEILVLVGKLRGLLKELPKDNLATLCYIVRHLRRSVVWAELTRAVAYMSRDWWTPAD